MEKSSENGYFLKNNRWIAWKKCFLLRVQRQWKRGSRFHRSEGRSAAGTRMWRFFKKA